MLYIKYLDENISSYAILHDTVYELLFNSLRAEYDVSLSFNDIGRGEYGKPYLINYPNIHFSLSHCKGLCVCLLSDGICGVDAENIRPVREKTAQRICSPNEYELLSAKSGMDKDLFFTSLWTLKESYAKADGRGISVIKNAVFEGKNGKIISNRPEYSFMLYKENSHIIALCGESNMNSADIEEYYPF